MNLSSISTAMRHLARRRKPPALEASLRLSVLRGDTYFMDHATAGAAIQAFKSRSKRRRTSLRSSAAKKALAVFF